VYYCASPSYYSNSWF
nr:immunoglobulin heavy chain junction region [Mus musculus]